MNKKNNAINPPYGHYIVIEGHDGTGKSTQVRMLQKKLLTRGIESIAFHEPAGNPIADKIRNIIKNGTLKRDSITDLLLFSASRHELWYQNAIPAMKGGKWVVASRNYYSSLAYQGYGDGLDKEIIINITKLITSEIYLNPSQSIILDLSNEATRLQRIAKRSDIVTDTFESKSQEFQARVQRGYRAIANQYQIPIIDASKSASTVSENIWKIVKQLV